MKIKSCLRAAFFVSKKNFKLQSIPPFLKGAGGLEPNAFNPPSPLLQGGLISVLESFITTKIFNALKYSPFLKGGKGD